MSDVRWVATRDRFPFGVGEELGLVAAPDAATATQRATALYGGRVLVRALLALESAKRDRLGPGHILPQQLKPRGPRGPNQSKQYRAFAAAKRARHHTPAPLALPLPDAGVAGRAGANPPTPPRGTPT